jgi:hypothetical protein
VGTEQIEPMSPPAPPDEMRQHERGEPPSQGESRVYPLDARLKVRSDHVMRGQANVRGVAVLHQTAEQLSLVNLAARPRPLGNAAERGAEPHKAQGLSA